MSETQNPAPAANTSTPGRDRAADPVPAAPKPVIPAAAAKRANASVMGMVLALLVSFAVILPIILLNVHPKSQVYRPPVDVAAVAAQAKDAAGFTPAAAVLPDGWSTNYARWSGAGPDGVPTWEVGYVTPDQQFIALTQTAKSNPTWLSQHTNNAPITGDRPVGNSDWQLRDKPGVDKSLILQHGGTTLVLTGSAQLKEFDVLAAAVVNSLDASRSTAGASK
ncbi:DUF4245 domain-containing protein [Paenarthrobacter sp. Z7-10]|uniref:DUF4245 domain-containing protein n=1 Tax=Paenarthrobacter sp. Z7-10 TaxID=2787635 RepID=UPI0022A91907|nr:DUF4245 domain-containing protein [Paenarthrobacter sp. Z7-10]